MLRWCQPSGHIFEPQRAGRLVAITLRVMHTVRLSSHHAPRDVHQPDIRHQTLDPRRQHSALISALRLPTSDFRLPTSDFRLPTSDFRLPISNLRFPTSDFQPLISALQFCIVAERRQPVAPDFNLGFRRYLIRSREATAGVQSSHHAPRDDHHPNIRLQALGFRRQRQPCLLNSETCTPISLTRNRRHSRCLSPAPYIK